MTSKLSRKNRLFLSIISAVMILFTLTVALPFGRTFADETQPTHKYTVSEMANKIQVLGAVTIYDYLRADYESSKGCYFGGVKWSWYLDSCDYDENYEYGIFYTSKANMQRSQEDVEGITVSKLDYIARLKAMGLAYSAMVETEPLFYNSKIHCQISLNTSEYTDEYYSNPTTTLEERLAREYFVCMYVKDVETEEIAYSDFILASYNSVKNKTAIYGSTEQSKIQELETENAGLKETVMDLETQVAELKESGAGEQSEFALWIDSNLGVFLGICCGAVLLLALFFGLAFRR